MAANPACPTTPPPGSWPWPSAARSTACATCKLADHKAGEIGRELDARHESAQADFADAVDAALDDDIGDDLLRLCSPPATRCCRPRRAWRSRCACWAA
jgi:hypothetical protein